MLYVLRLELTFFRIQIRIGIFPLMCLDTTKTSRYIMLIVLYVQEVLANIVSYYEWVKTSCLCLPHCY